MKIMKRIFLPLAIALLIMSFSSARPSESSADLSITNVQASDIDAGAERTSIWLARKPVSAPLSTLIKEPTAVAPSLPITATVQSDHIRTLLQQIEEEKRNEESYKPAQRIPVLEYTGGAIYQANDLSLQMKPEWFRAQIQFLGENGFYTISQADFLSYLDMDLLPRQKAVVIKIIADETSTRQDFIANIIPPLEQYQFKAYLFIHPDYIADTCDGTQLCWEEIKEWHDQKLFELGVIGMKTSGSIWDSFKKAQEDAAQSKAIIQSKLNNQVIYYAFPQTPSNFDPSILPPGMLHDLGYEAGFTTRKRAREKQSSIFLGSVMFGERDRYALPAYLPYSNDTNYPAIASTPFNRETTFPEMIWLGVGGEEITATPRKPEETPAETDKRWNKILALCTDRLLNDEEPIVADLNKFPTDISAEGYAKLQGMVEVRPICHIEPNNRPRFIVLHSTEGYASESLNMFRGRVGVGIHYMIDLDGTVYQLVPESWGTYHVSCYGNIPGACVPDCEACTRDGRFVEPYLQTIGIEIVNSGPLNKQGEFYYDHFDRPFWGPIFLHEGASYGSYIYKTKFWGNYTPYQLRALKTLVQDIQTRWPIEKVIGHMDIQPKSDPGPAIEEYMQYLNELFFAQ